MSTWQDKFNSLGISMDSEWDALYQRLEALEQWRDEQEGNPPPPPPDPEPPPPPTQLFINRDPNAVGLIVKDSLTREVHLPNAAGKNAVAGLYTDEGWRANTRVDNIRYDLPRIQRGAVEFTILDVYAEDDAHKKLFMVMWDPNDPGHPADSHNYRRNAWRMHWQKRKDSLMAVRWLQNYNSPIEEEYNERFRIDPKIWDGSPVRLKVEWNDGHVNLFVNDLILASFRKLRPYQPNALRINLGGGPRHETIPNAVYRDLKIWRFV